MLDTILMMNSDIIDIDFDDIDINNVMIMLLRAHQSSHICCEDLLQALHIR